MHHELSILQGRIWNVSFIMIVCPPEYMHPCIILLVSCLKLLAILRIGVILPLGLMMHWANTFSTYWLMPLRSYRIGRKWWLSSSKVAPLADKNDGKSRVYVEDDGGYGCMWALNTLFPFISNLWWEWIDPIVRPILN